VQSKQVSGVRPVRSNRGAQPWSVPRFRLRRAYGATGSEAVANKVKARAGSPLCRALAREEGVKEKVAVNLTDLFSSFLVYDLSTVRQQNTPIVVYCAGGEHCTSAIQVLRDLGI
jgi:rhodanese-related sulfurtransferase